MKNIRIFCLKNCHFLVVKFSVYLNRRVFVMLYGESLLEHVKMDGQAGADIFPTSFTF